MSLPDWQEKKTPSYVSTGAAVAIVFIWLGGVALTIFLVWLLFIYAGMTPEEMVQAGESSAIALVLCTAICALPMYASYLAMKLILGKSD